MQIRDIERKSRFVVENRLDNGASELAFDSRPEDVVALGSTVNPQKSVILVESKSFFLL